LTRRARLLENARRADRRSGHPLGPRIGFSGALGETGWDILRVGRAWLALACDPRFNIKELLVKEGLQVQS
jgi:hypothetical protein